MEINSTPSPRQPTPQAHPHLEALNKTWSVSTLRGTTQSGAPSLIPDGASRCHFFASMDLRGNPSHASGQSDGQLSEIVLTNINRWLARFIPRRSGEFLSLDPATGGRVERFGDVHLSILPPRLKDGTTTILSAFALEHSDRALSGRRWRTEVVLSDTAHGMKLHVGLYHGLRVDYVGQEPPTPQPSQPGLLGILSEDPRIVCTADGAGLYKKPFGMEDTREHGASMATYLANPKRVLPAILLNISTQPDTPHYHWNPHELAASCFGIGRIFVAATPLGREGPFLSELAAQFGSRYTAGLGNGGIRIFQPGLDPNRASDASRHRYFLPSDGLLVPFWLRDALIRTAKAQLERSGDTGTFDAAYSVIERAAEQTRWEALQQEIRTINPSTLPAATTTTENAKLCELLGAVEKRATDLQTLNSELSARETKLRADLKLHEELLEGADSEIAASRQLVSETEGTLDHERQARFQAEQTIEIQRRLLTAKGVTDEARRELALPTELPTDPVDVVTFLQKALHPRVVILDNAVKSAKDIPLKRKDETWHYLVALHQVLWPLHFDDRSTDSEQLDNDPTSRIQKIPARFMKQTGIDYTVNESSSTSKQRDLMRLRKAVFEGVEYDFSPHLKVGVREADALRIHFALDEQNRRIIVWHCGAHLDTAGTGRKSY